MDYFSQTAETLKQFTIGVGNEFNETSYPSFDPSTFNECLYHQGKTSSLLSFLRSKFSIASNKTVICWRKL